MAASRALTGFSAVMLTCLAASYWLTPVYPQPELRPDWMLPGIVFLGLFSPWQGGMWRVVLFGLIRDSLSLDPIGTLTVRYALLYAAVAQVRPWVFKDRMTTQALVGLCASLLVDGSVMMFHANIDWSLVLRKALQMAMWTPILVAGFRWVLAARGVRQQDALYRL
jgi:rod shape-determining protein MreD